MDLLDVTEMSMERTLKVFVGEVKVGSMAPDTLRLAPYTFGLVLSHHS